MEPYSQDYDEYEEVIEDLYEEITKDNKP